MAAAAAPRRRGVLCSGCEDNRAVLRRPRNGAKLCKDCFFAAFEREVHETIVQESLFQRGQRVAIGASGGKDSTVLAHVLKLLNERHDYGLELILLSVDEGITGYRDDSLETVERNKEQYQLPLTVVSYKDLYGWTMDEIVARIGLRNNCTFCGVFRRQALDRGAMLLTADVVATGHNADDIAETVLMNILRCDFPRLLRSTDAMTGRAGDLPRVKPLKNSYEKEIVLYAYHKKLDYFSTECIYSPQAYRGFAREFIKDLEAIRPSTIHDVIAAADGLLDACGARRHRATSWAGRKQSCERCGYMSSHKVCKACSLLEGLQHGRGPSGSGRSQAARPAALEAAWSGGSSHTGVVSGSQLGPSAAAPRGCIGVGRTRFDPAAAPTAAAAPAGQQGPEDGPAGGGGGCGSRACGCVGKAASAVGGESPQPPDDERQAPQQTQSRSSGLALGEDEEGGCGSQPEPGATGRVQTMGTGQKFADTF